MAALLLSDATYEAHVHLPMWSSQVLTMMSPPVRVGNKRPDWERCGSPINLSTLKPAVVQRPCQTLTSSLPPLRDIDKGTRVSTEHL